MTEDRIRVMFRIPDNFCKIIDAYAGYTHVSRPDVIIDACRQFYTALFLSEKALLDALDEQDAPKEVKVVFFYEEMSKYVDGYKQMYTESLPKAKGDGSIWVTLPPLMLVEINHYIDRAKLFKNIHDYVKAALMQFFSVKNGMNEHEKRMNEFIYTEDIGDKVKKLREVMKSG